MHARRTHRDYPGGSGSFTNVLNIEDNANDATALVLERGPTADGPFTVIATLPVTAGNGGFTGYFDSNLSPNTQYFYRVKAVNGSASSPYTGPVSLRTLRRPNPQPPLRPLGRGYFPHVGDRPVR